MTPGRIERELRHGFRQALESSRWKRHQVFLELFAGCGRIALCWQSQGFGAMGFELSRGAEFDLTHPRVRRLIAGWIRSGCVCGIWLATPCSTWSRARRGPRDSAWGPLRDLVITGNPGLSPKDQAKVEAGNRTAQATAYIINLAIALKVPTALENPASSRLWEAPCLRRALSHRSCSTVVVTMCSFGARWRKATKVALWHRSIPDCSARSCHGPRGSCQHSGQPHIQLVGRLTAQASAYPSSFATWGAKLISNAADKLADDNRRRLVSDLRPTASVT